MLIFLSANPFGDNLEGIFPAMPKILQAVGQ